MPMTVLTDSGEDSVHSLKPNKSNKCFIESIMTSGPLSSLTVIELGQGVAAPYCGRVFADYGANVIKVEPPEGDISRQWGPFPEGLVHPEKSGTFYSLNTNKRSISLDLNHAEERQQVLSLIANADLLIESFGPGQKEQLALDYKTLAELNPSLVMISITPFGQTGPYACWRGYDLNAYHLTATGSRYCGQPQSEPLKQGTFATDYFAGQAATAWGLAMLLGRETVGGGQQLDVSTAEVVASLFVGAQNIGGYAQDGVFERRSGLGMGLAAPASVMPCSDGYVWMIALETAQWHGLRRAMGDPEWAQAELFDSMFERGRNRDLICSLIQEWTMQHSKQEIMDACQAEGCPATSVFTTEDIACHPHLRERDFLKETEHSLLGTVTTLGAPVCMPTLITGAVKPAPLLGQHNSEVFASIKSEIKAGKSKIPSGSKKTRLPLEGIRVANFGWAWAGPVAGQTLGILGAEVYKIESRQRIDINRTLPPFAGGIADPDRSLQNHAGWANNGSISLNLKLEKAQQLALEFIRDCDVVFENFAPGVMDKLNLSYEAMCEVNPDIIMVSMPGAGRSGSLNNLRTYGNSLGGIAGLDSITGEAAGALVSMENAFADPYSGLSGALGALVALFHRNKTGQGMHVDCSQQEALMQMTGPMFMDYEFNSEIAGPIGNQHPLGRAAPHGLFPCRGEDRWIAIAVFTELEWQGLVQGMGNPEWAAQFNSLETRLGNIEALHRHIESWTEAFDDYELAATLQALGVAATPVLNIADLLHDPHLQARNTFIEVEHPLGFRETIYGSYIKASHSDIELRPGPAIGQDNEFVFKTLIGLTEDQYQFLINEKVIY